MYDIADNKRRRRIEKILSSYGNRVNYSVFEITASKSKLDLIVKEMKTIYKKNVDNIRIYILNKDVIKKSFCLNGDGVFKDEELYF